MTRPATPGHGLAAAAMLLASAAMAPATACERDPPASDAQLFAEAEQVFVARVVATRLRRMPYRDCEAVGLGGEDCNVVVADYRLLETLKGHPPQHGRVRELVYEPANCSLGLRAGWLYVFYKVPGSDWVPTIQGSFALSARRDAHAQERIDPLRRPPHRRPRDAD